MSKLFTPTQVGPYRLSHRIVMAPLTRMRSDPVLDQVAVDAHIAAVVDQRPRNLAGAGCAGS